ncbi:MAG: isoprenylcysteine carboxylmethyltransferase family protein [Planctomycetes bacterium]|nr:isoprenylcysteine carboxylmethyltransferase family protein [Planctomycetota bacterium]
MDFEPWLPFVFLALYVLLALLRTYHAVSARSFARPGPASAAGHAAYEGAIGNAMRYILAMGLAASVTLYGFFHTYGNFAWLGRFEFPLPAWARLAAVAAALAGMALLHAAHRTLGRFFSVNLEFQKEHALVTGGPYAYVRHPMYAAFVLFFSSSSLVAANALVAFFALGLVAYILLRLPAEERMLRDRFGAEFEAYAKRTGRLLPNFGTGDAGRGTRSGEQNGTGDTTRSD